MAYFSNGCEGEVLDMQCLQCPLGNEPCPVKDIQLLYNYDQLKEGQGNLRQAMNMLVDEHGTCQVKLLIDRNK